MTFLEELTAHKGGLIRLKWGLYWYGGRGWDGVHDRICLLMDAGLRSCALVATFSAAAPLPAAACTLLLIDGCPHWVWVSSDDLELL
jgi:hypothetical protein